VEPTRNVISMQTIVHQARFQDFVNNPISISSIWYMEGAFTGSGTGSKGV
jgi:hypothetical protein